MDHQYLLQDGVWLRAICVWQPKAFLPTHDRRYQCWDCAILPPSYSFARESHRLYPSAAVGWPDKSPYDESMPVPAGAHWATYREHGPEPPSLFSTTAKLR